jgi:F0F1-type ATP synthase assembly protein I
MPRPDNRHPLAAAAEWVSRITAIALEVVVCIWLGQWLDRKFGTSYWGPVGLVLGPVVGFWHLLTVTGVVKPKKSDEDSDNRP